MALFGWVIGQACNPCQQGNQEKKHTVTFDSVRFNATLRQNETVVREMEEAQMRERDMALALELERYRAEDDARHTHVELLAHERRERESADRENKERFQWDQERADMEERMRLDDEAMERQCQQDVMAFLDAEEREITARMDFFACDEEAQPGWLELDAWLKKNQYVNANAKKVNTVVPGFNFPLHHATMQRDATIVGLLLRFGADPMARNSAKQTPIDLAVKVKGCEEVLAVFGSQSQTQTRCLSRTRGGA